MDHQAVGGGQANRLAGQNDQQANQANAAVFNPRFDITIYARQIGIRMNDALVQIEAAAGCSNVIYMVISRDNIGRS